MLLHVLQQDDQALVQWLQQLVHVGQVCGHSIHTHTHTVNRDRKQGGQVCGHSIHTHTHTVNRDRKQGGQVCGHSIHTHTHTVNRDRKQGGQVCGHSIHTHTHTVNRDRKQGGQVCGHSIHTHTHTVNRDRKQGGQVCGHSIHTLWTQHSHSGVRQWVETENRVARSVDTAFTLRSQAMGRDRKQGGQVCGHSIHTQESGNGSRQKTGWPGLWTQHSHSVDTAFTLRSQAMGRDRKQGGQVCGHSIHTLWTQHSHSGVRQWVETENRVARSVDTAFTLCGHSIHTQESGNGSRQKTGWPGLWTQHSH